MAQNFFTPEQDECESLMEKCINKGMTKEQILFNSKNAYPSLTESQLKDLYAIAKTGVMFKQGDMSKSFIQQAEEKKKKLNIESIDKKVKVIEEDNKLTTKKHINQDELLADIKSGVKTKDLLSKYHISAGTLYYYKNKFIENGDIPNIDGTQNNGKKNLEITTSSTEKPISDSKTLEREDYKSTVDNAKCVNNDAESSIKDIANEIANLVLRKNSDYGNSFDISMNKYGPVAYHIRIDDKLNRLFNLTVKNVQAKVNESVIDTLKDIVGYSLLYIDYLENKG